MEISPFEEGCVLEYFSRLLKLVEGEILELDNEQVLKSSQTDLENQYIERVMIRPITLHPDEQHIEDRRKTVIELGQNPRRGIRRGERMSVPGTALDIAIPYDGDFRLWHYSPSSYRVMPFPPIKLLNGRVIITIRFSDDSPNPENLKSEIDRAIKSLAEVVSNLRKDVDQHNKSAPRGVKTIIQRKLEMARSSIGAVAALGIPIKRRDSPLTFVAPIRRRESPVRRHVVQTEAYQAEPVLAEAECNHILEIMRSMSLVMERSPKAFATLDEEAIRTHFVLQLNGHYEGGATGETFNASGKTDILIRVEDKNVFIAECKFWHGQKAFNAAIDQLLGYLTWRDAKCALLVFNKRKGSVEVSRKMHEEMEKRLERRATVKHDPNGDSTYIFVRESEPGREITITTQLYDIPLPELEN